MGQHFHRQRGIVGLVLRWHSSPCPRNTLQQTFPATAKRRNNRGRGKQGARTYRDTHGAGTRRDLQALQLRLVTWVQVYQ